MSKKNKSKDKSDKELRNQLESALLALLDQSQGKAFSLKQIVKKLSLKKKDDIKMLGHLIDDHLEAERIQETKDGSYQSNRVEEEITGVVDHVSSRFAYVKIGKDEPDIFVKGNDLGSAVDGDTVQIVIFPTRHGEHREGKVTKVLHRSRNRFVGKVELSKNFAFVVPDARKIHGDFFIYPENINGATTGDKVIIEVMSWSENDRKAEAKIVEVLGKAGENEAEIHSIMAEFELPFRFPERVINESQKISEGITDEEIKKRWDFRDVTTFTIDPEDAKDFDDAISFRKLDDGLFEIGVHIADVTHYIEPNSILDQEAFDRATSVYLVDRTVPMLPERLSNELCSSET